MNDTSPEIEARYREMLMARSGGERMRMASDMYATAVRLVYASITETDPVERRVAFFLRMYGADFDDIQRAKIVAWLRKRGIT